VAKKSPLTKTKTPGIFRRHGTGCKKRKRCDCPYVVIWRHRGQQFKETCDTFDEAVEKKSGKKTGDSRPKSKIRFGEYFPSWIESYAGLTSRGFSETTRPEYRRPIEADAMPRWRTWKLIEIESGDVRELFGRMRREGRSTSAIKKLRAALSALFSTAIEDGLIKTNPVRGVRIPPAPIEDEPEEEQAKALTRAELKVLLAAIPSKWHLFFEFLTHTGLRISEAIGLRWENVYLGENPHIKVREQVYRGKRRKLKSGAGRRDIPLSPGMAARLLRHRRDTYRGPKSPVFPSSIGTELIRGKVAERILNPAREAVGLEWVSFHAFRHTCASLLFQDGKNIKQVQVWLGHADPSFTLRTYVHLMDDGVGGAGFFDDAIDVPPFDPSLGVADDDSASWTIEPEEELEPAVVQEAQDERQLVGNSA
jgi:integrase